MIKIAFVIDTIESPSAGTEKQLLLLIRHLDRNKFQPYLCVLRSSEWLEKEFDLCPLHIIQLASFKAVSGWMRIIEFSRFLRNEGFTIVQTHFRDSSIAGILAARLAGIENIVGTRRNQGYWYNSLELMVQRFLTRWVTVFVANSESTRQWAGKTEGIDPIRIDVIYNALEIESFYKGSGGQRLAFRENCGFPSDAVIVGIVANLRPVKAIDMFIRAAKIVLERCPQARFIVVGEGPERERLEQLGTELGIATRVCFLGKRLDIPEILSCMDIGILSSSSESFSNSIVEYMAAGLPVVCTDVGGAREAVEDGINGFVVQSGDYMAMADRIVAILMTGNMALLGQNNRGKAEGLFSLPAIIQQYEQFYVGRGKS